MFNLVFLVPDIKYFLNFIEVKVGWTFKYFDLKEIDPF